MNKPRLIREVRVYLYDNDTHEVRVIDHTAPKPIKLKPPKRVPEVTPDTIVRCPRCGEAIRVGRRQGASLDSATAPSPMNILR